MDAAAHVRGPGLFAPLGSALGDRFDRRKVLVIADLAAAVGFVALAFAQTPAQLLVMAFITATLESPIWSVSAAAVPNLVGPEDLTWANGMVAVGRNIGNLVGPILGGVLVAVIAPDSTPDQLQTAGYFVFGLNAITFVGSAWLIGTTPGSFSGERGEDDRFGGLQGRRRLPAARSRAAGDHARLGRAAAGRRFHARRRGGARRGARRGSDRVRPVERGMGRRRRAGFLPRPALPAGTLRGARADLGRRPRRAMPRADRHRPVVAARRRI